jgi:DNA-binding response OmpR family regulator
MRVLLIEDEPQLQRILKRALAEESFVVDVAADGAAGLAGGRSRRHDAIVLDLMIPAIPGLEVLSTLRREGVATPVLILTARDGTESRVAGLDAGADDYITKPFELKELAARLRALIRRSRGTAGSEIRIADLVIDTAARSVARAGHPIDLRRKEYEILELLAIRRGRIVSHREIFDHVYDRESDAMSNVVDVHVCRLRSRIDRGFGRDLIHTVRGRGYRLGEP